jgi:molybdopterin converting factor small subunit
MQIMTIRVEFYGMARRIAGAASIDVAGETAAVALIAARRRIPALDACCDSTGRPRPGYILNVNGRRFVSDPHESLAAGDVLLLLSSDAGG